jgi:alpha-tubulin suppressor-like RCC1 family protein
VYCWGFNGSGQLGDGTMADRVAPTRVVGVGGAGQLGEVLEVGAGTLHTCARLASGIVCWGDGDLGQLGGAPTSAAPRVVAIEIE